MDKDSWFTHFSYPTNAATPRPAIQSLNFQSTAPDHPIAPDHPTAARTRFAACGRFLAQRSLMSSSRLTGGSQSVTAQTTALREP
ncbi:MAG: hypothetical protein EYR95_18145 [Phormidium sp. SL48-SHIP]|nr:MAG: hypothetical protein EYR95_18145 [Phormidium sp. SL48-SHIP]